MAYLKRIKLIVPITCFFYLFIFSVASAAISKDRVAVLKVNAQKRCQDGKDKVLLRESCVVGEFTASVDREIEVDLQQAIVKEVLDCRKITDEKDSSLMNQCFNNILEGMLGQLSNVCQEGFKEGYQINDCVGQLRQYNIMRINSIYWDTASSGYKLKATKEFLERQDMGHSGRGWGFVNELVQVFTGDRYATPKVWFISWFLMIGLVLCIVWYNSPMRPRN